MEGIKKHTGGIVTDDCYEPVTRNPLTNVYFVFFLFSGSFFFSWGTVWAFVSPRTNDCIHIIMFMHKHARLTPAQSIVFEALKTGPKSTMDLEEALDRGKAFCPSYLRGLIHKINSKFPFLIDSFYRNGVRYFCLRPDVV